MTQSSQLDQFGCRDRRFKSCHSIFLCLHLYFVVWSSSPINSFAYIEVHIHNNRAWDRRNMTQTTVLLAHQDAPETQLSLCAINVSSKSYATCKSSLVATSDFPARKIGSCMSSLIMIFSSFVYLMNADNNTIQNDLP